MGTGDKTDLKTDYFAFHKAQCEVYKSLLEAIGVDAALVTAFNDVIALCDAAVQAGSLRTSQDAVVLKSAALLAEYERVPAQKRAVFEAQKTQPESKP